ncbi:hypothetical protein BDR26DRAFT_932643 [Obelidium mucronatum]|nr:hypothetical protein BDR26DRAFT_932643 [Obelidium mucronatum]
MSDPTPTPNPTAAWQDGASEASQGGLRFNTATGSETPVGGGGGGRFRDSIASNGTATFRDFGAELPLPQPPQPAHVAAVAPAASHKKFVSSPLKDHDAAAAAETAVPIPHAAGDARKPPLSYALSNSLSRRTGEPEVRTNTGNTKAVMALLSEMWIFNMLFLMGSIYFMTFYLGKLQSYDDYELWNVGCYWKIGWLLPLPYTLICLFGLILPYRTPKFLDYAREGVKKRRLDNFYIVTVTKGDNREMNPTFSKESTATPCPKNFTTGNSKYKARALEWYRQTMKFTEHDWILHLDEESVIDDESVKRCLEFIWYEKDYHFGQGVILYNQYKYWSNWIFTVADAIRVGDDLSRFHLQYTYFHRPIFGAHGSFLMNNGLVENAVTWDLGSLTEGLPICNEGLGPWFPMRQSMRSSPRLPNFLPKLWAFFWGLGIFSLYCTIASIPLGFAYKYTTPRWFGFLKDVSFVTFVYLYILGIFIQDIDKGVNPFIVFLRIPLTLILQYICVVMEGCAVMYGIIFPPSDFDVIKK